MYDLKPTGQFRKDLKLCKKRGYDLSNIEQVLEYLHQDGQVPEEYLPHKLEGLVALVRTGTHSDLFKKSK